MRLFSCSNCKHTVFFENVRCTQCGEALAYLPDVRDMSALQPIEDQSNTLGTQIKYERLGVRSRQLYRLCDNSLEYGLCNWAIPIEDEDSLCPSCRLNDVVPNLSQPDALDAWRRLEIAKRRLYYALDELKLPIESRDDRPKEGLVFSFMQDGEDGTKVFTGHNDGLITINIAEADDPLREKLKKNLGESYRTLLGHFRHEIGHYYWDRLVKDSEWLSAYRALFGDESVDYGDSLKRHYAQGAPKDWPL
ncbi:MAG TPA: putative zinc-binding metallopeptidase, partial [Polyangiales bacterium]|nr:putative zinc-binding metallopeptidase [Polyangiales bacterium]